MANFERQADLGFALDEELPSAVATAWDISISQAVNGDGGSVHDGDVELGSLTVHRELFAEGDLGADGELAVGGDATIGGAVYTPVVDTDVVLADMLRPALLSTQAIAGTPGSDNVTLDLGDADHFLVKIGSETNAQYTLGNVSLTIPGSGSVAEPTPGSVFWVRFEVNATSSSTAAVERRADATWPASLVFSSESDQLLMLDTPLDGTLMRLTQVGTPSVPKFHVHVERYRK